MPAATKTAVEIVRFKPEIWLAHQALHWLSQQAPDDLDVRIHPKYEASGSWLLFWGPGAPERRLVMERHVATGGHAIALDLAYWQRETKVRISIDSAHPQAWVMRRTLPVSRFRNDGVKVANRFDPTGPILVAGIGKKATVQYGGQVAAWEADVIAYCRHRWPTRPVFYRPKQKDAALPSGAMLAPDGPIDDALTQCSLLLTWHSNVAVDAIRMGIPVICRDGAAAAVCPSTFSADDPRPLPESMRDRFLENLAWFQWNPITEAKAMWTFLQEILA